MKKLHISSKLKKIMRKMDITQKLLLSYILLIILPLLITTLLSYNNVSRRLVQQFQYSSNIALTQTSTYLDKVLEEIENSTDQIAFNKILSSTFQEKDAETSIVESYRDFLISSDLIKGAFTSDILYSVEIFIDDDPAYVTAQSKGIPGFSFVSLDSKLARELDAELANHHHKILWKPPRDVLNGITQKDTSIITCARYMKTTTNYQNIGIISVNIQQQSLTNIINQSSLTPNSIILLYDAAGNLMAVSNEDAFEKCALSESLVWEKVTGELDYIDTDQKPMLINSVMIEAADWTLVSLIPYNEMLEISINTRNTIFLIMLLVGFLFLFIAHYFSKLLTQKIRLLSTRMKEVNFDDYTIIDTNTGNDEIDDLIDSFNHMLYKIDDYAESQYQLGIQLKNSELKALQAQINPHFLYNTLDLIHWIAESYDAAEISRIVALLSKFYKLCLSNGKEIVTVSESIALVKVYVELQNFRFNNSVELNINISDDISNLCILKLLLQPMIENAILHGILEKDIPTGVITIDGWCSDDDLFIKITDDGIGMTHQQIRSITDISNVQQSKGYGIKNIIERIKLYYGNEYGLTYESILGEYTSVLVKIPRVINPPE